MINLETTLEQHADRQKKYFNQHDLKSWANLDDNTRAEYVRMITSYIVEETVEVNRELKHRYKPFKRTERIDNSKLRDEICDIFIFWMGLVAVAGYSGREMEIAIENKLGYNEKREDHVR